VDKPAISIEQVRQALALPDFDAAQSQRLMAPAQRALHRPSKQTEVKLSAVLVLIFPINGMLSLVLMKRTEYPGVHSGQISFPGGRREEHEELLDTALREAQEELGINRQQLELLGQLAPIYVPPSNFEIHPFVAYTDTHPIWIPERREVAAVIEMPLGYLFEAELKKTEVRTVRGVTFEAPFYDIKGYKVWGATAVMLSEFEGRLRAVM
jgi:8-oxo-dGTP pyrophosphatase MutT (NUDIX family)